MNKCVYACVVCKIIYKVIGVVIRDTQDDERTFSFHTSKQTRGSKTDLQELTHFVVGTLLNVIRYSILIVWMCDVSVWREDDTYSRNNTDNRRAFPLHPPQVTLHCCSVSL